MTFLNNYRGDEMADLKEHLTALKKMAASIDILSSFIGK